MYTLYTSVVYIFYNFLHTKCIHSFRVDSHAKTVKPKSIGKQMFLFFKITYDTINKKFTLIYNAV